MKNEATPECKKFLKYYRLSIKAKKEDRINKRYSPSPFGYLAPDDNYYKGHCAYCAEVKFLNTIYKIDEQER